MPLKTVKDVQIALIAAGYDVGPTGADGEFGRETIAGLKAFQRSKGLQGLGILGPKTLALLFSQEDRQVSAVPPWFSSLNSKRGMHEKLNNKALAAYLKSDNQTLGDPSKLPWCGDAVQTSIALTLPDEVLPANPYYALNWLKFGISMDEPALGAVLVFTRSGGGHVGFYSGENSQYYLVLGGNQRNSVSIAPVLRKQCVGIRWPKTVPLPRTGKIIIESVTAALDSYAMS